MNNTKLTQLVDRAIALDRQIHQLTAELDTLKDMLIAEAETRSDEHTSTASGGWSWTAIGTDGCIARVIQDGPTLKASVSSDKEVAKLKDLFGPLFTQLFEPRITYRLIADFRSRAEQLLGKTAAKLIRALTSPGRRKVAFETKDKETP